MFGNEQLLSALQGPSSFRTTHWSLVLKAGQPGEPRAAEALEALCRTYWYPLYAYARRRGCSPDDAQDVTQGFIHTLLVRESADLGVSISTINSWEQEERFPSGYNFELQVEYTGLPQCRLLCGMVERSVPAECLLAMSRIVSRPA